MLFMKIRGKETFEQYFLNLILLGLTWGGFVRCRLADSDTLWGELNPESTLIARLSNFRWLGYVGDWISYNVFHFYPYEHRTVSLGLFLAFLAAALIFLQYTFSRVLLWKSNGLRERLIFSAITALCFINVLTSELFYFTESFLIFEFSLLLTMVGCFLFSRRQYIWGWIFLVLAPMFYQMSCIYAALVLCTLAYLESREESFGRLFGKEVCYLCAAMFGGILNYLTGPWIDAQISARIGYDILPSKQISTGDLSWLIFSVPRQIENLYESSLGLMMPLWLPLLFSVAVTVIAVLGVLHVGKKTDLAVYILYRAVLFLLMCGMPVVSFQGEFVCRVLAPFYVMQAMSALTAFYWLKKYGEGKVRYAGKIFATAVAGYLAVQCFFIQAIISNRVLSENLDILYANEVLNLIEKYEEETGNAVTEASFCVDSNYSASYEQVYYCHTAVNSRIAGRATYSLLETVASWRGMHVGRGETNQQIYEQYFAGKNWDHFEPSEQVIIENGVLYWCVF